MYPVCLSSQVLQSTMFYDRDFLTFASPLPPNSPRYLSLLRPFTPNVWLMIGIFIVCVGVTFLFISKFEVGNVVLFLIFLIVSNILLKGKITGFTLEEFSSISATLWYCFGTLIGESITRDKDLQGIKALRYVCNINYRTRVPEQT